MGKKILSQVRVGPHTVKGNYPSLPIITRPVNNERNKYEYLVYKNTIRLQMYLVYSH